ncbi:hypothetical protein VNO77_21128 [Canavalia gladiata]|uniref:Uncharacterized protein n=1 Tax=Canavalia gladiata TaxID=3824 RepID=A0AAN9LQW2_CANGL
MIATSLLRDLSTASTNGSSATLIPYIAPFVKILETSTKALNDGPFDDAGKKQMHFIGNNLASSSNQLLWNADDMMGASESIWVLKCPECAVVSIHSHCDFVFVSFQMDPFSYGSLCLRFTCNCDVLLWDFTTHSMPSIHHLSKLLPGPSARH